MDAMRAEYEVEGDERVGRLLVKSFDGRPYLGQVGACVRGRGVPAVQRRAHVEAVARGLDDRRWPWGSARRYPAMALRDMCRVGPAQHGHEQDAARVPRVVVATGELRILTGSGLPRASASGRGVAARQQKRR